MDKLTDAELVEAVAREVLGWEPIQWIEGSLYVRKPENETSVPGETYLFEPFHDANDWMMVLERQVEWQILRDKDNHWCVIWRDGFMVGAAHDPNLAHAVLEAALKAKGEKE